MGTRKSRTSDFSAFKTTGGKTSSDRKKWFWTVICSIWFLNGKRKRFRLQDVMNTPQVWWVHFVVSVGCKSPWCSPPSLAVIFQGSLSLECKFCAVLYRGGVELPTSKLNVFLYLVSRAQFWFKKCIGGGLLPHDPIKHNIASFCITFQW
jgi:hypothetical protein